MAERLKASLSEIEIKKLLEVYSKTNFLLINKLEHRLEYIQRNWSYKEQLEFAQKEKETLLEQLDAVEPDVFKIHCYLQFYSKFILRLTYCIEFEKSGLKFDPEKFKDI